MQTAREVVGKIKAANCSFFSILADETSDCSGTEQLVICIRWVADDLECHEDYLTITPLDDLTAKSISERILDFLIRAGLDIDDGRGQCYDGASAMKGQNSGVATIIKQRNDRCLYLHCHGHSMNLAVGDTIKTISEMKETFEVARELIRFIKMSPKKCSTLEKLRKESENPYNFIIFVLLVGLFMEKQ